MVKQIYETRHRLRAEQAEGVQRGRHRAAAGRHYVWDLEKYPWEPFEDNMFDEIYVSHYAEHTLDLMKFMNEIWRISENDAKGDDRRA